MEGWITVRYLKGQGNSARAIARELGWPGTRCGGRCAKSVPEVPAG